MCFSSQRKDLDLTQDAAQRIFNETGIKPKILSIHNFLTFCRGLRCSLKLVFEEKEIIFFAILQWIIIVLAYMIWTQILDWIPDSVWKKVGESKDRYEEVAFTLINFVFLGWSFLVVVVASYPLSLLNAAMIAVHYLRSSNQTSTIVKCFNLASKNLGRLWVFTTIDAWITVTAILDRLPKKNMVEKEQLLMNYCIMLGKSVL